MSHPIAQEHSVESLDLVLAYILGDVTDEQRSAFEARLASGDPEFTISYHKALETFSSLPKALTASIPPPFVKERIMARARENAVDYALANGADYRPPMSIVSRALNLVPGYGNIRLSALLPAAASKRRTASLAFVLLLGFFASAYAIEQFTPILHHAEAATDRVVERVRNAHGGARYSSRIARLNGTLPETDIAFDQSVGVAPDVDAPAEDPSISAPMLSEPKRSIAPAATPTTVSNAQPIPKPTDAVGVDMALVDADFYFHNDPTAIHYSLTPVNGVKEGKAHIYWNPSHSDAYFSAEDLPPTVEDQHYVIYYTLDDGTMERMRGFTAVSAAQRSFMLRKAPNAHVTGAKLVLESGNGSATTILTATTRITK